MSAVLDGLDLAKLILKKASSRQTGMNDFSAWHKCSAVSIGQILTLCRTTLSMSNEYAEKYLRAHGVKCPACGGDIESHGLDMPDSDETTANVECAACGKQFVETWQLVGVEEAEEEV